MNEDLLARVMARNTERGLEMLQVAHLVAVAGQPPSLGFAADGTSMARAAADLERLGPCTGRGWWEALFFRCWEIVEAENVRAA